MAPGGTPEPVILRLHQAVLAVAADTGFQNRLKPLGYGTVTSATPAALTALVEQERPQWRRLVEISGARLD
jgi:tripartite-type tricarboxylate transporter receptor subunit TctC